MKSKYEWHNHVGYGINAGLTLDEIAAVQVGPEAENWNEEDRAILRSVDEQMANGRISDSTWATLRKYYDRRQLMDLVFCIGHYVMTSWAIASLDIQIEKRADEIGLP